MVREIEGECLFIHGASEFIAIRQATTVSAVSRSA